MPQQSVLITGAGPGGLGYTLATAFQRRGFLVIATDKHSESSKSFESVENINFLEMDVTSQESMSKAFQIVSEELSPRGIDFLVNNAGYGYTMPLLEADIEQAKKVFDVNVWGALAVTQVFSPLLRKANGTVANIGSLGGFFLTPWIGIYSASKAALMCISETMKLELQPLGVNVITFVLGTIKTTFFENATQVALVEDSAYKTAAAFMRNAALGKTSPMPMDPSVLAERLVQDMVKGRSGKIWRGRMASVVQFVMAWTPTWIMDWLIMREHGFYELQRFHQLSRKVE